MAINLLSGMANNGPVVLPSSAASLVKGISFAPANAIPGKTIPSTVVPGGLLSAAQTSNANNPLGINAKSPYSNQSAPAMTLPKNQVAASSSTGNTTNTGLMSAAMAGSSSNPYVQNAQGQWVPKSSLPAGSTTGGNTDPVTSIPASSVAAAQNAANTSTTGTNAATGTTGASTLAPQADSATSPQGILGSLVNTATTPNPLMTQDIAKQQELAGELGPALATVTNTPGLLANQNARASNLTSAYGQEMQGLGTNISALQNEQSTQQSGLNQAGSLATQQVQAPYGTPLYNPTTGQFTSSATSGAGGGAINSAVSQAVQLMQNGATQADAFSTSGLDNFGYAGQAAFAQAQQQASGGTYNPTLSNAFAQSSASQGAAFKEQAVQIQNALQSLENVVPAATNIVSQINSSDSPLKNAPIQQYIASLGNTDAASQMNLVMADIKKYTGQLLAMNAGGIPTDVSNSMASIDPSLLNASQLGHYLQMADYLGNQQKSAIQSQIYGLASTPYAGYTGGAPTGSVPANNANTSLGSGITSTSGQIAAGAGLDVASGVAKAATNGGNILSFILGEVL